MKSVSLQYIDLDSFKSFTERVRVDLSKLSGLTLIAGNNQVEPRLGANGAGKSTLWDALCFCLYGVSIKGTKITNLVSYGKKKTAVSCGFLIDGKSYIVSRSGPPGRPMIDGTQVEQGDVDKLVGLSHAWFLNSVVFGQSMPLFVDRSIPERGELLDEILDLQLWVRASAAASAKCAAISSELNTLQIEIGRTEGRIESLDNPDDIRTLVNAWDGQHSAKIETLEAEYTASLIELDKLKKLLLLELPDLSYAQKLYDVVRERELKVIAEKAVVSNDIKRLNQSIAFYKDNAECATCGQVISPDLAKKHQVQHSAEIAKLQVKVDELGSTLSQVQRVITVRRSALDVVKLSKSRIEEDRRSSKRAIDTQERAVEGGRLRLGECRLETNPHIDRLENVRIARRECRERLRDQRAEHAALVSKLSQLEFWKNGFKRVRLFCIGKVLRQLELDTMNAASSLGLLGWKITYATETETRSGSTKTGVQVLIESPDASAPFSSWSGGEGQRVRLCSALGFAGLIQRWAGVKWDLEVFDEPTAWLSEEGIEDLLELFKTRADSYQKRIMISDHRVLQHAGINNVISIVKDSNGSHVENCSAT